MFDKQKHKCVKMLREAAFIISMEREFHNLGPAKENDQCARDFDKKRRRSLSLED
jgi:hypothetical protein